MKIQVKGHSGCKIDIVNIGGAIYICKSTTDTHYLKRLALQANKQQIAAQQGYKHIRIPKIYEVQKNQDSTIVRMEYVYSKNFIEFFESAGFEQIDYLIESLEQFVEDELRKCELQNVDSNVFVCKLNDVASKCRLNFENDVVVEDILSRSFEYFTSLGGAIRIPVGICHGDLTFSNILFNGNNYYLIDFLDSFVETPLQDIVKIRQDTAFGWSPLMYSKEYDSVRLRIIFDRIDKAIDGYFTERYDWYRKYYGLMQLMNMLRILPYTRERKILDYLKCSLLKILDSIEDGSLKSPIVHCAPMKEIHSSNRNLLIPVAADKPEYANKMPYVFALDDEGTMLCLRSVMGMNLKEFDNIYFTILRKHDQQFFIGDLLRLQFERFNITNATIVVLDNPTVDEAETIYTTLKMENIEGSIFIKDADSFFIVNSNDAKTGGIAVYSIEDLDLLAPKDKSYVAIDEMYYLTNIIEKRLIGSYISVGGYYFTNAELFLAYYYKLRSYGKLYLSHIVYSMLLDKHTFRPIIVTDYKDWGNVELIKISEI